MQRQVMRRKYAGVSALAVAAFVTLVAATAHATAVSEVAPGTTIVLSEIGAHDSFVVTGTKLSYSDFDFSSYGKKGCGLGADELSITFLSDGIDVSGPVTVTGRGTVDFKVAYTVMALDPGMPLSGVSLELFTEATANDTTLVEVKKLLFAKKHHYGKKHRGGKHHYGKKGWGGKHDDHGWYGDDDRWHGDDDRWHGDDDGWHGDDDGWHGDDDGWHGDDDGSDYFRIGDLFAFEEKTGPLRGCDPEVEGEEACTDSQLFDEITLDKLRQKLRVVEKFHIAGEGPGDEATFLAARNRFTMVPEPASAALMGLGLAGLGLAGRRRRASAARRRPRGAGSAVGKDSLPAPCDF